ncbi:hypothetical protein EDB89DRAFT_1902877 [Lactarius sanguifluus]|nr:hypothetical protein EDB89DRAFT_1902877 [Lactarius sanguifluus]
MEDAIFLLPEEDQITLEDAACAKRQKLETKIIPSTQIPPPVQTTVNPFFETVSPETQQVRIAKFIDATGQNATKMSTCAVCAGSFFAKEPPISPRSPALNSAQASVSGTTRHQLFGKTNYGRGYDSEAGYMGESMKKHDRPTRP